MRLVLCAVGERASAGIIIAVREDSCLHVLSCRLYHSLRLPSFSLCLHSPVPHEPIGSSRRLEFSCTFLLAANTTHYGCAHEAPNCLSCLHSPVPHKPVGRLPPERPLLPVFRPVLRDEKARVIAASLSAVTTEVSLLAAQGSQLPQVHLHLPLQRGGGGKGKGKGKGKGGTGNTRTRK